MYYTGLLSEQLSNRNRATEGKKIYYLLNKKHYSIDKTQIQENKAKSYPKYYSKTGLQPFSSVTSYFQETGTCLLGKRIICHFFCLIHRKEEKQSKEITSSSVGSRTI